MEVPNQGLEEIWHFRFFEGDVENTMKKRAKTVFRWHGNSFLCEFRDELYGEPSNLVFEAYHLRN